MELFKKIGILLLAVATVASVYFHVLYYDFDAGGPEAQQHRHQAVRQLDARRYAQLQQTHARALKKLAEPPDCPEPEVVPHSCSVDPMGGECAVSWTRLLEHRKGAIFVTCGDTWHIRWRRHRRRED